MSTSAAVSAARPSLSPAARRARSDRRFFTATAVAQVALVVWGFSPSYYLRPAASELTPLSSLLHVHGALFSMWLVLLLVQVSLVAARRTPVHRQLGWFGGVLALSMLIVGSLAAVDAARRGSTLPGMTPLAFLIIPILGITIFGALAAAAIALRRVPDAHKRLMMLATAGGLVGAGVARIALFQPLGPAAFLGVPVLFALALVAYDVVTLRRVHGATLAGTLFILVMEALQLTAANSAPWLTIAAWLTA
jgi:hypothetical protein